MSSLAVSLVGKVRKILEGIDQEGVGSTACLALNEQRELIVAPGSAPYAEIVRLGRAFEVHTVAAIAAVVARPTTAHMLALYNDSPDDGEILVIDRAWALNEVSAATAAQATLLGCLGQVRENAPTDAALPINALNGMGGKDSSAKTILNATTLPATTGIAANWRVLPGLTGGQKPGAATTPGYYVNAQIDGRIIVPAGRYFAIHVMANVVTETFTCGIEFHKRNSKLGR